MKFKSVNIGEFTFSVVGNDAPEFQFTVTGIVDTSGYAKIDAQEFLKDLKDLEDYISRFGEERDDMVPLHDAEDELLNLKRRIISALGVSLSDRMIRLEDASELHDFSYPITLIAHQTKSHENVCKLLDKANKKCTELEDRVEKAEDEQKELTDKYNNLRTDLIDVLGIDRNMNDRQLLCKVSSLYYFRREVQRKLDCLGYSDENTIAVLLNIIDKAKCFDDMDKQYMETTKSLCEIAKIIERLQSTDEKKDM